LQHLGLPTQCIDFTRDPETAGAFAVGRSPIANQVEVLVVEMEAATSRSQVAHYQNHPFCERARRQSAYGYNPISYPDLKSPYAAEGLGLTRCLTTVRACDLERFRGKYVGLIDIRSDPVAGLARCRLTTTSLRLGSSQETWPSGFRGRLPWRHSSLTVSMVRFGFVLRPNSFIGMSVARDWQVLDIGQSIVLMCQQRSVSTN
jgi:hypothetical protein